MSDLEDWASGYVGSMTFQDDKDEDYEELRDAVEPKKDSQALTGEFEPKNFLDKVPPKDTTGRDFPQWKRQLMARQLAEKALHESEERKKKEEEEARFRNMPVWKRALIEKKEAETRVQRELDEEKEEPEIVFPQPAVIEPVMVPADRDGLPLAPWQLEIQRRKGQAN